MTRSIHTINSSVCKTALSILLLNAVSACALKQKPSAVPSPLPSESTAIPDPTPTPALDFSMVPYTTEERPIELGETYIYGNAYIPSNGIERHPTVILCHGIGNTVNHTAAFAMMFAERGIASYAFDFCNGTEGSQSCGDPINMTVHTEAEDLNHVIDFIKQQEFVDPEHIYLLGQSQGGYVVTEVAHERQSELSGIILMYPAYNIPDLISEYYPDLNNAPESITMYDVTVGKQYLLDAVEEDIEQDMRSFEKEVLLLHGSDDPLVPISYSIHASEVFPKATLITIDGAEHGFFGPHSATALEACLNYIKETY